MSLRYALGYQSAVVMVKLYAVAEQSASWIFTLMRPSVAVGGRITNPHARSGWITNPAELVMEEEF